MAHLINKKPKTKLKILELCLYSAGICGVWQRVKQESIELTKKGHEVRVFSSNFSKGTDKLASHKETINEIKINRFSGRKLGGESFMFWFNNKAMQEAIDFQPDIIIAHNYRHLHTTQALKLAKRLRQNGKKCKVFLVTHAPFIEGNTTRTKFQTLAVKLYDLFIASITLPKFNKIISISHWEEPYLHKLGVKNEKLVYIPNGIPDDFFKTKALTKEQKKMLFLGRISPIKSIETIISALPLVEDKEIILEIVGPYEEGYLKELKKLVNEKNLEKKVIFSDPIFDLKEKITKIDSCKIFILPSKKEGMPQSLIEAMARSKIILASDIPAIKDLIKDEKNGYLFEQGNITDLANKINFILKNPSNQVKKQSRISVEELSWEKVIKKIESLF